MQSAMKYINKYRLQNRQRHRPYNCLNKYNKIKDVHLISGNTNCMTNCSAIKLTFYSIQNYNTEQQL